MNVTGMEHLLVDVAPRLGWTTYILVCLIFHAPECLLSQFYFGINDTVANGLNFIYNTFENDYYQENEVCFIALIGSCIMYFLICMKWSDVMFFRNNYTQKGSQTLLRFLSKYVAPEFIKGAY